MIPATTFAGRTVAVFGLGMSGIASARSLVAGGAQVACWDDSEAGRRSAAGAGLSVVDLKCADWSGFGAFVLAPGVPLTHPAPHWTVEKARAAGIEVIGDTELFFRERARSCPAARVVGITGTNGKSTTTALTAHLLRECGFKVSMGGNIGRAVLDLEPLDPDRIYVIEFSSYQIDLTPSIHCNAAALMNVTPDHLDRHGTMENYAAVKARIFDHMTFRDVPVISVDDEICRQLAATLVTAKSFPSRIRFSSRPLKRKEELSMEGHEIWSGDGRIWSGWSMLDGLACLGTTEGVPSLRGRHNRDNAAAAVGLVLGVTGGTTERVVCGGIERALASFPGLAHRMEVIGRAGKVLFVNDSKATNADSTEKALASWERGLFVIFGGKPKEGGITSLEPYFPRIAKAYLIGQAADEFARTLDGKVAYEWCDKLDRAVAAAARDAAASSEAEPVVLLSPACASFDQFRNFEVRGDAFRKLVAALPGVVTSGEAA